MSHPSLDIDPTFGAGPVFCSDPVPGRILDLLTNLLAVIHRDGGQHTGTVGLEQSVQDAVQKVSVHNANDADTVWMCCFCGGGNEGPCVDCGAGGTTIRVPVWFKTESDRLRKLNTSGMYRHAAQILREITQAPEPDAARYERLRQLIALWEREP